MDRVQAEQIALHQLDGGERLLWSGVPSASGVALGALPATAVGVPFLAFACFWVWTAYSTMSRARHLPGPWSFFPLFGIPFVLVGLAMLAAPLWAWRSARSTVYAVTDKRALIIQGEDRAGAAAEIYQKLADQAINVTASQAIADGVGRFGMILWVKPADLDKAAKALGA